MALRILVTNDDGIESEGLLWLTESLKRFGDVIVCAPKNQQSGKSQGIDLIYPFEVKKYDLCEGVEAYAVDSTPADCVRFAILGLKEKPDIVVSGVNKGYNVGRDIVYSGTVGAVYEANGFGYRALALSTTHVEYSEAFKYLDLVFEYIKEKDLYSMGSLYNINIPPVAKGFKITRQGGMFYSDEFDKVGEDMYKQSGKFVYECKNDLTLDTDAVMDGYISVTPLTLVRTDCRLFEKLKMIEGLEKDI